MTYTLDSAAIAHALPKRQRDAHKGDFGHVLIIGGDRGMPGAVRMAGEAALRVGAGLVSIATRPEHIAAVVASRPELMCHAVKVPQDLKPLLAKATVIVIGPGLGQSVWSKKLLAAVLKTKQPKLLDADALNLLSQKPIYRDDWILTPHVGEAARLLNAGISRTNSKRLNTSPAEIQQNRIQAIKALQDKYGGVIVLKGAGTLVQGKALGCCEAGNPGMASGGMGDVLSGVIGGLLAQKLALETAARVGVLLHAMAGDLAAKEGGERGLLASDLFIHLRSLVNHLTPG